jgi:cephalosporin-C deacetylase
MSMRFASGSVRFLVVLLFLLAAPVATAIGQSTGLSLTPFNPSGSYDVGERAGWTVSMPAAERADAPTYVYTVKKNNFEPIASGELDLSAYPAEIAVTLHEPAMLYVLVAPKAGDETQTAVAGAAIAPTKLEPVVPRPADFDEFWQRKISELNRVPPNPVLTPRDSHRTGVDYGTIRMDHVNGGHIHGQYAKPAGDGQFPAMLILQWASPPYPLQKEWVTEHAANGWLALNIEPHDVLPTEPQPYYDNLPDELKRYEQIGADDRDTSYFLRMYLAAYRAVDYLASHPKWNGKTLLVMGTSMGGQQSLCVAGLHPKITHLIVNVPAGCDLNAPLHGRQAGYPFFPDDNAKVMETARYFDAVNFAPNIKARSLVAMGFVDAVCPPAGIWTAFNQIPAPKEAVPMIDSPHNHQATPEQQAPYTRRSAEWLAALTRGEEPLIDQSPRDRPRADEPAPRTDANSKKAHKELVRKARLGGGKHKIDVYFIGDSITRRWGCTDPQYAELLEHWNKSFHGWNVANFGWGGDTTSNILWRLNNGELDGLQPKVFVILAGTNNLSSTPGASDAEEIAAGVKAIIDTCQRKAPAAKIVLTALFPRNDHPAMLPVINDVNKRIAQLADGNRIRFLNVNDQLADEGGKLKDGMMHDGLHPTRRGYEIWARGLKPILTEWLGPPATIDHAPPATGDPSVQPSR